MASPHQSRWAPALLATLAAVVVLGACSSAGGSPAANPTQLGGNPVPGDSVAGGSPASEPTSAGGQPTTEATSEGGDPGGGGGNGTGGDSYGSIHLQLTGDLAQTVDLPFVLTGSLFDYQPNTAYLSFSDGTLVALLTVSETQVTFTYHQGTATVGATDGCTVHLEALDSHQARGSISCPEAVVVGTTVGTAMVTATFEAHD